MIVEKSNQMYGISSCFLDVTHKKIFMGIQSYIYTQFKSSLIFLTLGAIFDIELTLKNA